MEAAMANKSTPQIVSSMYPIKHFAPPAPILQPPLPTTKPPVTNSTFSFTPIVPSNVSPQKPVQPPMEVPTVQKKQNGFDLPDNCPTSLR